LQDAFADNVITVGHPVIIGFELSVTITLKVQVAVLPEASVAVYVTGVVPRLNVDPDVCVLVKVEREQLSVAVGAFQVATPLHDALADRMMFDGHPAITGFILSVTITLNVQVVVLPPASVAV
jgi:hypothetical protein